MAKAVYTLRRGREQAFRRTVSLSKPGRKESEAVQLVFEPGVDVELSEQELQQCHDLIDVGMIVDATRDSKGRLRGGISADAEVKMEELAAMDPEQLLERAKLLIATNDELRKANAGLHRKQQTAEQQSIKDRGAVDGLKLQLAECQKKLLESEKAAAQTQK